MRSRSLLVGPLLSAALLIGMAAVWSILAPTQFGGQASYVIIAGASMEPALHSGDLVVARQSISYEVGDVVTYAHPQVGPVIHRIIHKAGDKYILQGDNNDWIDSYQPTHDEIHGKAWITLPGTAKAIAQLRTPLGLALLSVSIGLMVFMTIMQGKRGEEEAPVILKGSKGVIPTYTTPEVQEGWTMPFLAILLGGILLGVVAFSRPILKTVTVEIPYQHRGEFSYSAKAPASVYDKATIQTGDPVFHSIVSKVKVFFEYEFAAPGANRVTGDYQIIMTVSEPNGWRRQIELIPATDFSGDAFTASAMMDITRIKWLIGLLQQQTNFNRAVFDIRIIPIIRLNATLAGQRIEDQFRPALQFKLDDHQLYLDGSSTPTESQDPLSPVEIGMVNQYQQVPATLTILGMELRIETARWIAGASVTAALIGLTYIFLPLLKIWRQGESSRLALRYADLLVSVEKLPRTKAAQTFDVASFSDLAKLAQSHKVVVLHQHLRNTHTYLLHADDVAYRYSVSDETIEEEG